MERNCFDSVNKTLDLVYNIITINKGSYQRNSMQKRTRILCTVFFAEQLCYNSCSYRLLIDACKLITRVRAMLPNSIYSVKNWSKTCTRQMLQDIYRNENGKKKTQTIIFGIPCYKIIQVRNTNTFTFCFLFELVKG